MKLSAIILSGGESRRMGTPKALLEAPGSSETFLDRLIRVFRAQCAPVIVVLGHEADRIRAGAARADEAVFVVNERYREGQLSSLQCGVRAVPPEAEGFLFTPVDIPMVAPGTVAALAGALAREDGRALVALPRCAGRHGHPVCCRRAIGEELLTLAPGAQARDVIHRHAAQTCYVDVDDPGILRDIDDPAAYQAMFEPSESK
ncbi:MAG TPA: nucleotidyltransferase family protein [Bryobacteraceae bacterium]|nr:nucleotidyltransferase family protein [Bryobacteraceae bacterium]